jgi:flap endonuclease-1
MEAREILEAMGVPCFQVQGEHEGEGVASSLVLQGMADYVVSEDTVRWF